MDGQMRAYSAASMMRRDHPPPPATQATRVRMPVEVELRSCHSGTDPLPLRCTYGNPRMLARDGTGHRHRTSRVRVNGRGRVGTRDDTGVAKMSGQRSTD